MKLQSQVVATVEKVMLTFPIIKTTAQKGVKRQVWMKSLTSPKPRGWLSYGKMHE